MGATIYNTVYPREVMENQFKDNLETAINHRNLMTIDNQLAEGEGMTKRIVLYTYDGQVEKLLAGESNSEVGEVVASSTYHTVQRNQQTWRYTDDEFYSDPTVVDAGLKLSANVMVNNLVDDFYAACDGATLEAEFDYAGFSYDNVVDAITLMNLEDESGLFLIINPAIKGEIRKNDEFKAKELGQIIRDGQIGTISGVPVVVSKAVPTDTAFLMTKEAITCFMKKDVSVEHDRDIETKINTIVEDMWDIVALTDATKIVKMVRHDPTEGYTVLTEEPEDWETDFTGYYELVEGEMVALTGSVAPEFEAGKYYSKD